MIWLTSVYLKRNYSVWENVCVLAVLPICGAGHSSSNCVTSTNNISQLKSLINFATAFVSGLLFISVSRDFKRCKDVFQSFPINNSRAFARSTKL